jgi:3-oxoacyl-[acyl-carrier protein] reductase
MAVPSEIANLAVFMVSDMGNMIVGDTFYMTGGSGTISMHH